MRTYRAAIYTYGNHDFNSMMEFERDRFTSDCYKTIVGEMFFWACQGCGYNDQIAIVCEDLGGLKFKLFTIKGIIRVDVSNLYFDVYINNHHIRTMTIAE